MATSAADWHSFKETLSHTWHNWTSSCPDDRQKSNVVDDVPEIEAERNTPARSRDEEVACFRRRRSNTEGAAEAKTRATQKSNADSRGRNDGTRDATSEQHRNVFGVNSCL